MAELVKSGRQQCWQFHGLRLLLLFNFLHLRLYLMGRISGICSLLIFRGSLFSYLGHAASSPPNGDFTDTIYSQREIHYAPVQQR